MNNIIVNKPHITGVDTNDVTGIAAEFVITIFDAITGLEYLSSTIGTIVELGTTGSYRVSITFHTVGQYIINIYHATSGNLSKTIDVVQADDETLSLKMDTLQTTIDRKGFV